MPTDRSQAAAAASRRVRATRPAPRPRRVVFVRSLAGLRWDRLGRVSLLVVLALVTAIGAQRGLSFLSSKAQADRQQAIVHRLLRDDARLAREQHALNQPTTIAADARKLGMVRLGEHPYVVTGLPRP